MGGLLNPEKDTKKGKGDPGDNGRFSRVNLFQNADATMSLLYPTNNLKQVSAALSSVKTFAAHKAPLLVEKSVYLFLTKFVLWAKNKNLS